MTKIGNTFLRNIVAIVVTLLAFGVVVRVATAFGLDWAPTDIAVAIVNTVCFWLAVTYQARVAAAFAGVLATFNLAELCTHLVFGIRSVQSGPVHWAVLLAAAAGVALGVIVGRPRNLGEHAATS